MSTLKESAKNLKEALEPETIFKDRKLIEFIDEDRNVKPYERLFLEDGNREKEFLGIK